MVPRSFSVLTQNQLRSAVLPEHQAALWERQIILLLLPLAIASPRICITLDINSTLYTESGVIHSYDMTPANVHDINYLKDVKFEFHDCSIFGDCAYISAELRQDLFSSVGIKLEVPYRLNMKDRKPIFKPFAKVRKRIETNFSQLCDQFMIFRNYAKTNSRIGYSNHRED